MKNILGLIVLGLCQTGLFAQEMVTSIDDLIGALDIQSKNVQNIKITSEMREQTFDPNNSKWVNSGYFVLQTLTLASNDVNGRLRLDVPQRIAPWAPPKYPFSEENYTVTFDGNKYLGLYHAMGVPDRKPLTPLKEGEISQTRSAYVNGGVNASGILFCSLYYGGIRCDPEVELKLKSAQAFRYYQGPQHQSLYHLEYVPDADNLYLEVSSVKESNTMKWRLDPARGYALIKYEFIWNSPAPHMVAQVEVTRQIDCGSGFWYPGHIVYTYLSNTRYVYDIKEVKINQAPLPANFFTQEIPVGYRIDDKINNKIFVKAPDPGTMQKNLDDMVEYLKKNK